jgi:hypothetical protein
MAMIRMIYRLVRGEKRKWKRAMGQPAMVSLTGRMGAASGRVAVLFRGVLFMSTSSIWKVIIRKSPLRSGNGLFLPQ